MKSKKSDVETVLTKLGRSPVEFRGAVNTPLFRNSTVVFSSVKELLASEALPFETMNYGRLGNPTHWALEDAVAELEDGYKSVLASSGLAMIVTTILAYATAGTHLLVPTNVYRGVRRFCTEVLQNMNIDIEFYDPSISAAIAKLIRSNTALVYVESPGSTDFEIADLPAIVKASKARNIPVVVDNTWATPLYYKPLALGADVSLHSATKYILGHSDALLGIATCTKKSWPIVKRMAFLLGANASPEDAYMALRGIRSLSLRMAQHQASALKVAKWLSERPEVVKVFYPALKNSTSYRLWKRDFTGASGRFAFELIPCSQNKIEKMLDNMEHFEIGHGWGGYESLILPELVSKRRYMLRLSIGFENSNDLILDLANAFARLK